MNSTAIQQLAVATLAGTMPFPEIIGRLLEEGVDYYRVDYRARQIMFYSLNGNPVVASLTLETLPDVHADFDASSLRAAIHDSQHKGQEFPEFSRRAVLAGVQSYFAFLKGKRVMYLGRQGDHHVEWFPGAAPGND